MADGSFFKNVHVCQIGLLPILNSYLISLQQNIKIDFANGEIKLKIYFYYK